MLEPLNVVIPDPCFDAPIADPLSTCSVRELARDGERLLAPCDGPLPCWRIAVDPQDCLGGTAALVVDWGDLEPADGTFVEAQCVAK